MRFVAGPGGVGALLDVKVVPGASRTRIAGPFGEGVRVQVAAPPERGRANAELGRGVAEALAVRPADVIVLRGETSARKTLHVRTLSPEIVAQRLS